MSTHTPGPWTVIDSLHGAQYKCVQIGSDDMYTTGDLLVKDAPLIAAAPDLLAELIHLQQAYANRHSPQYRAAALMSAGAAIAKAEGK